MTPIRKMAVLSLIVAAAGIIVQMLGGAKYPLIPPGAVLLVAAAGLFALRNRWTPLVGLAVPLFLTFGAFATPNAGDHLSHPSAVGAFVGTLIQLAGMAVADVSGLLVVAQSVRKGRPA